jgi:hypothetical protein
LLPFAQKENFAAMHQNLTGNEKRQQQVATRISVHQWKVGSTSTDTMAETGRVTILVD